MASRLQRANRPDYDEALGALETLHGELDERNQSAADSLAEGLDETLTLHRLGVSGVLGRSLKTTNCLESVNALVEERCRGRSLAELEPTPRWLASWTSNRAYGVMLPPPSHASGRIRELKIDTTTSKKQAA